MYKVNFIYKIYINKSKTILSYNLKTQPPQYFHTSNIFEKTFAVKKFYFFSHAGVRPDSNLVISVNFNLCLVIFLSPGFILSWENPKKNFFLVETFFLIFKKNFSCCSRINCTF